MAERRAVLTRSSMRGETERRNLRLCSILLMPGFVDSFLRVEIFMRI